MGAHVTQTQGGGSIPETFGTNCSRLCGLKQYRLINPRALGRQRPQVRRSQQQLENLRSLPAAPVFVPFPAARGHQHSLALGLLLSAPLPSSTLAPLDTFCSHISLHFPSRGPSKHTGTQGHLWLFLSLKHRSPFGSFRTRRH